MENKELKLKNTPMDKNTHRSPLIAVLLSLGATGLGHIYCGKLAKGLTLFFVGFAFAPIIAAAMRSSSSALTLVAVMGSVLVLGAVFFYALIDACMLARKSGREYEKREYNRWYIYLLFIIVSLSYPTNLSSHIREYVAQAYKIPSVSMAPGILRNDHILLNKTVYSRRAPKRGEAVVFAYPNGRHRDYIKRIVALPGDSVEVRDHVLYLNGAPLVYEPIDKRLLPGGLRDIPGVVMVEENNGARYRIVVDRGATGVGDFDKITVPNGHCFVLGDNRTASVDSRQFGPVPLADIKGRVEYIYLPAGSWSRFGRYEG